MRKFLMAAALLAVVACGEKKAPAPDTTHMATMPTTVPDSTKKADSIRADSMHKADSMKMADSMAKANMGKRPKKP